MKDYYAKHKTEYSWLIKEEGWVRKLQGVRETQMALGNGFFRQPRCLRRDMP